MNWFLQLDPLVAISTVLTTGTLYSGLLWGLATIILTVVLGRFFCGWVCPFGAIHQFVGYLGRYGKPFPKMALANQYSNAQSIKYYILLFILCTAAGTLIADLVRTAFGSSVFVWIMAIISVALAAITVRSTVSKPGKATGVLLLLLACWTILALIFSVDQMVAASLQSGLLDPIPLVYRSVNLVLIPLLDGKWQAVSASQRHHEGAWLIAAIFLTAVLLNLKTPRFYCRYVCPLGALFGILGRYSLWRMGKTRNDCAQCKICEANCEGACEPANIIRTPECVLCMNCMHDCRHGLQSYRIPISDSGEAGLPELSRRGFAITIATGVAVAPFLRLDGNQGENWNPSLIRPPGSLPEPEFLSRCIKCGQCMRVCPTNIIQPSGLGAGPEGLWTPVLNFRIGTSGCQLNCIACSHICPTAAIRPITISEKLGREAFAESGPIRIGTAFVDHGRCLPWAMDKPCIVCQENCPVSPKAIFVKEYFSTIRGGVLRVKQADALWVEISNAGFLPGQLATGDYFISSIVGSAEVQHIIQENTDHILRIGPKHPFDPVPASGDTVEIQVRLQRPHVDIQRCIGCGICEHACPVSGRRAIRVTAENETRSRKHSLVAGCSPSIQERKNRNG